MARMSEGEDGTLSHGLAFYTAPGDLEHSIGMVESGAWKFPPSIITCITSIHHIHHIQPKAHSGSRLEWF